MWHKIIVEDIDLDGQIEVVQTDGFPHCKCFRAIDGTLIWENPGYQPGSALLADIDQDGQYELLGSDGAGTITIHNPDGTLKSSFSTGRPNASPAIIEDIDGDGIGEIFCVCHDGTYWNIFQVRKPDGTLIIEIATGIPGNFAPTGSRSLADSDGDGVFEVFSAWTDPDRLFRCYRLSDGALLWSTSGWDAPRGSGCVDVDGDGLKEFLAVYNDASYSYMKVIKPDGTLLYTKTVSGFHAGEVHVACEDANNDGLGDLSLALKSDTLRVIQG